MTRDRISFKFGLAALAIGMVVGSGCNGSSGGDTAGGTTPTTTDAAWKDGSSVPGGIPVGLVASENGDLKPWGEDSVKGAKLAVTEYNATAPEGKKVNLLIEDSGSKPEQGKSATEKLISQDKAICILGEVASGITAQMGQAAEEKGVPDIAIGATRTDLTEGHPNMFRVCYTDAFQGPVMAKFAYEELGLKNVALITDKKQPYSTGLSKSFRAYFTKLGGKIVDEQFYETGQTQFQGQLTNLKAKNPDGLFMSGYFNETGPIARQAREAGLTAKMMGGDGWDSSQILVSGGDAILDSYLCNHYNNKEDRPEVKEFLDKWNKAFTGEPGTTMGALAYDAAKLACEAISKATDPKDPKTVSAAIGDTVDFKGVSGTITLKGKHGNPPKRALVVQLKKEGQVFAKAYEMDEATGYPK